MTLTAVGPYPAAPGAPPPRRAPPPWLRRLAASRAEQASSRPGEGSVTERFRLVCDLMAFALDCLRAQAERSGVSVGQIRLTYERAGDRLRARQR